MDERILKHKIIIDNRESAIFTGITDVISFDDEIIISETSLGILIIKGENLHISNLNLDSGDLTIFGKISNLNYEDSPKSKGKSTFFGKIFK